MQIQPLSQTTISSAIQLTNIVFPHQNLLEKASFAFRLSLMSGWLPKLLLRVMSIDEARYWVALSEDVDTLGVTGLYKYIKDEDNSLWLGWTCVAPTARGKGVGGMLLDFAIAKASNEGKKFLRLYTSNDPNESAAQHLYERRGLRVVGVQKLQGSPFKRIYRELSLVTSV